MYASIFLNHLSFAEIRPFTPKCWREHFQISSLTFCLPHLLGKPIILCNPYSLPSLPLDYLLIVSYHDFQKPPVRLNSLQH